MVGIYDVSKWSSSSYKIQRGSKEVLPQQTRKLDIHVISDGITRLPILEGEISHIELPKGSNSLGLTIVGGADTPLRCVVVQDIFPDSFVALDGRLAPGDQIIEIDGMDMTAATHEQVCTAIRKSATPLKMAIYRERIEIYKSSSPMSVNSSTTFSSSSDGHSTMMSYQNEGYIYVPSSQRFQKPDEEIHHIPLQRQVGKHLGIKLGGKRAEPGVFIVELMPGSVAGQDQRLQPHDRLLYINCEDVRFSRPETASKLIRRSKDVVNLIVCRTWNTAGAANQQEQFTNSCISSQDSLFGSDETDHLQGSSSVSSSSRSDCSVTVEDEQLGLASFASDNISDQSGCISISSRASPDNNIMSSTIIKSDFDILNSSSQYSTSFYSPDIDTRLVDSCQHEIQKSNDKWPLNRIKSPFGMKKKAMVQSLTQALGFGYKEQPEQKLQAKHVTLRKGIKEGLGMRIGGGINSNEGDTPIYVANINAQGPIGKSKQIKRGDIVMSMNENSLLGLTHSQAVAMLKSTSELCQVSLELLEGPETSVGPANFVPSWLYWQKLPRSLHISKGVVLHRAPGTSLGFSIVGGNDPHRGNEPVHVLFVVATSPAAIDGRLRCGDQILAVDGQCLEGVSHSTAVCLLKRAGHRVALEVVSWMGTEL